MKWITATEITQWADKNSRQCQEKLPELIRRLIQATASSIHRIDFPCDSSVTTGGWDGHLETESQSAFFPSGTSKWEIGSEKTPGQKADKDYENRKKNPLGANSKETIYVVVTTRPWPKRADWESAKKAEGHWKDVWAIGADGLELWLASAPGVALWFAEILGKITHGVRSLEAMWEEWSVSTNPAFTPDIVISGRAGERDEIHKWLAGGARIFEMQGDSPDEPVAFLYASIAALPDAEREIALSRAIVVETIQQLRDCYQSFSTPLIIAAPAECAEAANLAVAKGHHVFLTMDAKTIDIRRILRLTRPKREALQDALKAAGLSEADAQRQIRDSSRSLPVLRRRLFRSGLDSIPAWAEASSASVLLPVLLAGAWVEGKEGDQELIEALSGTSYQEFIRKLIPMAAMDDAPIWKVGNVWKLKSPLDAWFLAARHLDAEHFARFRKVINSVLTQTNPKYDLPPDKRWAAGIYGKNSQHSDWIRRGLIESLTLLGVYGERMSKAINGPEQFVASVVKDILEGANTWEAWASLKDVMPLIAEAAPDTFLEVLEEKIDSNPALFQDLLRDEDNQYGLGDCLHSGLLWAIESTAWNPEYLIASVHVFLRLAQVDPGGRWSNRPLASLTDVLLPAIPQTNASFEERFSAYELLIEKDPDIAWNIAERHIGGGSISPSHMFRWRDTGGDRTGLEGELKESYIKYINLLLPKWCSLAVATNKNLSSAVEKFLRLPEDVKDAVLSALDKINPGSFSKEETQALRHSLRHTLNWISNYGEDKHKVYLPALRKGYDALEPKDLIERYDWLFTDGWPQLPEAEPQASKGHEERLAEVRKEAAREFLDNLSLEKIVDYGQSRGYSALFFHAIATAIKDNEEDIKVVDTLVERIEEAQWSLVGYSMGRIELKDNSWAIKQIERLKEKGTLAPKAAAAMFRGMKESDVVWDSVEKYGKEIDQAYWKIATGYTRSDTNKAEDAARAVDKLLGVGRPQVALNIAGDSHISLPSQLLQRLILDLLKLDGEQKKHLDGTMFEFHLTNIFNQLYDRKELSLEEIGKLEWPFAQVFDRFNRHTNAPLALHRSLQKDPAFFVDLLTYLYKKDDGTDSLPENMTKEQVETVAMNAREVLEGWYLVPGVQEDGSVNEEELNKWIDDARKLAKSKAYLKGCDLKLAEVLSRFPSDKDGMWPHVALRNSLERIKSSMLDEHIPYALYNSRGVRTRSVLEGGDQERKLAVDYHEWSKAMKTKWPRTSKVLKSLARMLDNDAKREDVDLELRDIEYS